jgi:hypothetical protein
MSISSGGASGDAAGLKEKGNALFKAGDFRGAIEAYTQATAADPKNHVLYRCLIAMP